jgi:hypothetical protein
MNVIVLVKQGAGGSGVSRATRYISRRERDVVREGSAPRKLFSEKEDALGFFQANRILGNGEDPKAEDVLHLVISLEKEADFQSLGADEDSRLQALREATRSSMKWMAEELKTNDLRWVAGVHRNTDNPHIHLLIHRDYTPQDTGRIRRLKTLPKEMRVSWRKAADGTRQTDPGGLSLTFGNLLDKRIEQARDTTNPRSSFPTDPPQIAYKDRVLLGRALIAEDKINRLEKMRNDNLQFGDRYRYEFTNGRNLRRGFSEHDIHQRGSAKTTQLLAESHEILTSEERRNLRGQIIAAEFRRHDELVRKHRETRAADLETIEIKLSRAHGASRHLIEKAAMINDRFETEYGVTPIPILPRAHLSKLQDSAIERRETNQLKKLEEIRTAIAAESGAPTRTESEISRLRAQLFVAQSNLTAEQDSASRFEETKHQLKWEFPSDPQSAPGLYSTRKSLTDIDRSLAWERDQSKFIGTRRLHWDDDRRNLAQIQAEELSRLRELVIDRIEAKRVENSDRIMYQEEFVAALAQIVSREEERHEHNGLDRGAPNFTREEFRELDNIALRLRDPQFYRTYVEIEHSHDVRTDARSSVSIQERTGRALARVYLAEIEVRESELNLSNLRERRELIDVVVKDDGKRMISIARLADLPPASPLEQLFRPLIVPDERQGEIVAALDYYEQKLIERCEQATDSHTFLFEEARKREAEFSRLYPEESRPAPMFTYREMSLLELHAARETDPSFKAKYETLYRETLEHPYEDRSRHIVIEKHADELLDSVSMPNHPDRDPSIQIFSNHSTLTGDGREIEIGR